MAVNCVLSIKWPPGYGKPQQNVWQRHCGNKLNPSIFPNGLKLMLWMELWVLWPRSGKMKLQFCVEGELINSLLSVCSRHMGSLKLTSPRWQGELTHIKFWMVIQFSQSYSITVNMDLLGICQHVACKNIGWKAEEIASKGSRWVHQWWTHCLL